MDELEDTIETSLQEIETDFWNLKADEDQDNYERHEE